MKKAGPTYIVQPIQFPPLRVGRCLTLEVNIVSLLDIIRESGSQAQGYYRRICLEMKSFLVVRIDFVFSVRRRKERYTL